MLAFGMGFNLGAIAGIGALVLWRVVRERWL